MCSLVSSSLSPCDHFNTDSLENCKEMPLFLPFALCSAHSPHPHIPSQGKPVLFLISLLNPYQKAPSKTANNAAIPHCLLCISSFHWLMLQWKFAFLFCSSEVWIPFPWKTHPFQGRGQEGSYSCPYFEDRKWATGLQWNWCEQAEEWQPPRTPLCLGEACATSSNSALSSLGPLLAQRCTYTPPQTKK